MVGGADDEAGDPGVLAAGEQRAGEAAYAQALGEDDERARAELERHGEADDVVTAGAVGDALGDL